MNVARSSLKIAAARVGSLLLTFVGTAFFAQELGARLLGIFFLFQAVLAVSELPANLGTRIAVEKRISEGGPADQIIGTAIVLKATLLLLVTGSILVFQSYLNQYIGANVAGLLIITIILQESAELMMNVLKGELRVGETATLQFAYSFTWVGLGVLLVQFDFGVFGLVYGVIVGKGVQLAWAICKTSVGIGQPTITQARSLVDYAKYSIIPEIDGQVHNWMDILIIGFFVTQAAVGAYEIAWRVAGPVLLLTSAIGTTIFPQISSWESEDSKESLERLLPKIITPSLVFVFPAFFGGILLSEEILGLIFGQEFTAAWLALIILLAGKLPRAIRQIVGKSLLGLNRPDLVTHAALVDIIANLVLNIILIWHFGILGAALGTTLSMTIGTIHRTYYLSKIISIRVPYYELGWCLLSSLAMYFSLHIANNWIEITTVIHLAGYVFVGATLYSAFVLLYSPLRMKTVEQARDVIR
ncbi:membrane protein involved in the export of O-antigen and teichoic acid [Natrialba hulunbeirensis JCM 10989]|uniref:Membrane protein involved in the export of O-antigen and teichoic acid n=1 Tax=Natrialba hulunbeirensis JCM 10989 TaxID=1227493 RepID=M0AEA6_9EURY|nr:flippase [Natrialba hulunbeirensis]ELY95668.1 membrane protein involved in the export of O-antigen and teichoic acid [Natrialba hulunbeirensis JCM 10989]